MSGNNMVFKKGVSIGNLIELYFGYVKKESIDHIDVHSANVKDEEAILHIKIRVEHSSRSINTFQTIQNFSH